MKHERNSSKKNIESIDGKPVWNQKHLTSGKTL